MEKIQVISSRDNVQNELSSLGLSSEILVEVAKRGFADYNNATENDPPGTAGSRAYSATVRGLRDLLCPHGWKKINQRNICFTSNEKTKIAIIVSSGDENVGIENGCPQTKYPKGECYRTIIADNQELFGDKTKPQASLLQDYQTLVLLYHYDRKKDEIRLELSSPTGMGINDYDYVNEWHKRIIFAPIPCGTELDVAVTLKQSAVESPDIDIPVKRRQK